MNMTLLPDSDPIFDRSLELLSQLGKCQLLGESATGFSMLQYQYVGNPLVSGEIQLFKKTLVADPALDSSMTPRPASTPRSSQRTIRLMTESPFLSLLFCAKYEMPLSLCDHLRPSIRARSTVFPCLFEPILGSPPS